MVSEVNGCWHGDIHYLTFENEVRYLFALIDDRSRFIVGWGISEKKDQELVFNVLNESFQNHTTPLAFWTDNGKENVNIKINQLLRSHNIYHIKTKPRTPRANGKIERWWVNLEKTFSKDDTWDIVEQKVDNYVNNYNNMIPHFSLEKIGKFHATPYEVFTSPHLQKTNIHSCQILLDGKPVSFGNFLRIQPPPPRINVNDISSLLSRPVRF